MNTDDDDDFYDFRKIDHIGMSTALKDINWNDALAGTSVDEKAQRLHALLMQLINRFVPRRKLKRKYSCKWMTPALAHLRNVKNRAYNRYKRTGSNEHLQYFIRARNEYLSLNTILHAEYQRSQAELLKDNPKLFWKIVNGRRGTSGVPQKMKYGDRLTNTTKESADLFASFFESVFVQPNNDVPLIHGPSPATLTDVQFTKDEILHGLSHLNVNKGSGPDMIPNVFLRQFASALCEPLTHVFNVSLQNGKFPTVWKTAFVVQIFKSG